ETRKVSKVPLSDQRGLVTISLQQGCNRRVIFGNTDLHVGVIQWFFKTDWQAVGISSGNEAAACRCANRSGRVVIREPQARFGHAIQDRSHVIGTTVTTQVAVTQVVRENK